MLRHLKWRSDQLEYTYFANTPLHVFVHEDYELSRGVGVLLPPLASVNDE